MLSSLAFAAACSSDDDAKPNTQPANNDAAASDANAPDAEQPDAGACEPMPNADLVREAPVFLADSSYKTLFTLGNDFPFGVTQVHAAAGSTYSSRWGRHGGPLASGFDNDGNPTAVRWTIPSSPTAAATMVALPIAREQMPSKFFWGNDGMIDLPFGNVALHSYSTSATAFAGEALLYNADYTAVVARAHVNGYYAGAGLTDGCKNVIAYAGLSPLAAAASTTQENGLYAAEVCAGALLGATGCKAPAKLFAWTGASGPVTTDAHGNVFVAASVSAPTAGDVGYGFTRAQMVAGVPAMPATLGSQPGGGTAALAAVAPTSTSDGWLLGLDFSESAALYAYGYQDKTGAIVAGAKVSAAISPAKGQTIQPFTDAEGDLWLAVSHGASASFVELRRKP